MDQAGAVPPSGSGPKTGIAVPAERQPNCLAKELIAFANMRGAWLARQFTSIMFWGFSKKLIDDGLSEKTCADDHRLQ